MTMTSRRDEWVHVITPRIACEAEDEEEEYAEGVRVTERWR